jgi:hypothetical protein
MRIFGDHSTGTTRAQAAGVRRGTDVTCLIRRCLSGDVEVTGIDRYPAAWAAIAGHRPRDPCEPWRESTLRVRLVRAPDDPDDPNTIVVETEAGRTIGYVDRRRAIRMAPSLDRFLRDLAAKREFADCVVDVRCTAVAWAEWDVRLPASPRTIDAPAAVGMTLLVDDRSLGIKLAAPELPALV